MTTKIKLPFQRVLLFSAVSLASGVSAADNNRALEEVIVTAQKREQSLREVPSTISVISADYLEKAVATDFSDIGTLVSGIEIGGASDGFESRIRVRGIGTNPNSGISPSVGIFINEIPLSDLGLAYTNTVEIERVEVLKGPQSTLFGKGVSSGAIVITTQSPQLENNSGYLEANIGSHGLQEYYAGGNVALGDKAALRASLYSTEEDGQIENILTADDAETREGIGGRAQLMFEPSDDLVVQLTYEAHDLESQGAAKVVTEYGDGSELLAAQNEVELITFDPSDRKQQDYLGIIRETDSHIAAMHIDWDINDEWSLTSITAHQDWERTADSARSSDSVGFDSALGPQPYQYGTSFTDAESLSQELRLEYDSDNWSSIVGVFYSDSDNSNLAHISRPVIVGTDFRVAILAGPDINTEEWGIFTHNNLSLNEQFDLTVGLRYSDVARKGYTANIVGAGEFADEQASFIPLPEVDPIEEDESWDDLSGGVKLSYHMNPNISFYVGYDRGFKAGNFTAQLVQADTATLEDLVDEETADAYELGVKGLVLDNTLQWAAAVFYQEYSDYQVGIVDPIAAISVIDNAGSVEVEGIEMDFVWQASQNMVVDGAVSYIDSVFDEYENAPCTRPQYADIACTGANDTQDLSGEDVNGVSPWSANLNATWSDTLTNGSNWYARLEYVFRDDRTFATDLDPETEDSSYSLLNASLGWNSASENIKVALWGKNLTDTDYLTNIASNSDGTAYAGLRADPGFERSYGVRLRYSF